MGMGWKADEMTGGGRRGSTAPASPSSTSSPSSTAEARGEAGEPSVLAVVSVEARSEAGEPVVSVVEVEARDEALELIEVAVVVVVEARDEAVVEARALRPACSSCASTRVRVRSLWSRPAWKPVDVASRN